MIAALLLAAYPWLTGAPDPRQALSARIPPPAGYTRDTVPPGSFAAWLRGLPLLPGRPPVKLFDGRRKANQDAHLAVVNLDTGRRDLQQCADAVMRLRAEHLFAAGRTSEIAFALTSGERVSFARWTRDRPVVRGQRVSWTLAAGGGASHESLRRYLDFIFTYAGSQSLSQELAPAHRVTAGDVFIKGGFPGHAVIVLDTAAAADGRRVFLLGQSYMPAQEMHVLKNPQSGEAWYDDSGASALITPEWTFPAGSLRRFPSIGPP